jgi:hypothetical protein
MQAVDPSLLILHNDGSEVIRKIVTLLAATSLLLAPLYQLMVWPRDL